MNKRAAGTRLVCLLLAVAAAGTAACILWYRTGGGRKEYAFAEDAQQGSYVVAEYRQEEQLEAVQPGYHRIMINARPTADPATGLCNLMIGNPQENRYGVSVLLYRDIDGKELFSSETISPGERMAYVYLEDVPEEGEHLLTAVCYLINPKTGEISGEIEAGLVLTVTAE